MQSIIFSVDPLKTAIGFSLVSCVVAFLWAPFLTKILYKYKLTRRNEYDATLAMGARKNKTGIPVMGGLLIIITVAVITIIFNWERKFTWVPIGVMLLSALLGAIDDIMNIYGHKRRNRKISQVLKLIRVHADWKQRVWLVITLPWSIFKRASMWIGSHPGKGVFVHEKLILQFIAGAITAWWIYFKLGEHWQQINIPFDGLVDIGWWIIPLIIFFVMFTANAVNVADGMDGLAGGSLIITFSALTILSWITGYNEIMILNATTVGALITYTYFNIKPARFQMGDVGSLGLGSLLAINAIVINQMLLLPFIAFIFYAELLSVIIQIFGRHILGRRIFKMAPIHHHFELRGWTEEKTVMRFWIIHAAVVILGIWIALY
ncbi:MAG TPA: phospho-N-acetylmuramoyl-pentapeptide-transferase [Candidatus Magasanikbacteria bacterium]|jgi:phospho-N-acetylmuramoyl-pentapeptide-transferase|nr:phospho-N-acetylmuramoyl-pentapeptide-transferase [Candidatus Magasanikbacteria bacterium]HQF57311.1 phospho-N-acetylmuramoyl-pentapeptide-transferase [Candidatus Magasanikbacteria bacterium]HQL52555.1 phospho-N-acetylmuramoyl-pentapeptide-transferase [Candidatus Magasanikbacteria bacterium]